MAEKFDQVELYVRAFGLVVMDQLDVRQYAKEYDDATAICECLSYWKQQNPSGATIKALLDVLLRLGKKQVAQSICDFFSSVKHSSPGNKGIYHNVQYGLYVKRYCIIIIIILSVL